MIACDIRRVALEDGLLDLAIFCLSLHGANENAKQPDATLVLPFHGATQGT